MQQTICFITTGDIKTNAASKRALGMANPLGELGWQVHIIMQDTDENHIKSKIECNNNIAFHFFPTSGSIKEIWYKRTILNTIKPDYIYLCGFVVRNIIPFGISKKPNIIIEHSELTSSIPLVSKTNKLKALLLESYSKWYADELICASKYLYNYYLKKKPLKKILYLPYAFNDELYKKKGEVIDNVHLNGKSLHVFLYVGSITHNYGLFTMLEACAELLKHTANFKLILAGTGKDLDKAREFVTLTGITDNIEVLGYVDEIKLIDLFAQTDCFIAPLHNTIQDWARCPSKLFMYLPYEKPIITCRIGEAIEIFGDDGHYFEINSAKSLSDKMNWVLENKITEVKYNIALHTWNYRARQFHQFLVS